METYEVVRSANFILDSSSDEDEPEVQTFHRAAKYLIKTSQGAPLRIGKPKKTHSKKSEAAEPKSLVGKEIDTNEETSEPEDTVDLEPEDTDLEIEEMAKDDFFFDKTDLDDEEPEPKWEENNIFKKHKFEPGFEFDEEQSLIPRSDTNSKQTKKPEKIENDFFDKDLEIGKKIKQAQESLVNNRSFSNVNELNEYDSFVKSKFNRGHNRQNFDNEPRGFGGRRGGNNRRGVSLPSLDSDPNGFRSAKSSRGSFNNNRKPFHDPQDDAGSFGLNSLSSKRQPLASSEGDPNGFRAIKSRGSGKKFGRARNNTKSRSDDAGLFTLQPQNGAREPLPSYDGDANGYKAFAMSNRRGGKRKRQ